MAAGRKLALLGGTTSWGDCRVALRYLARPRRAVEGRSIVAYEDAFARLVGVRFAYSFAAGRVGLYGLLQAFGVRAGDEVLLSAPTHIVVANAVRYLGARPVYVDCDPENCNMDLAQAAERVTSRTRALILQHTFGVPADIEGALRLSRRHGLRLIEDCVHALGATYRGRPVGSFGDAAFFSTEETKTISTTMGGMAVTDDPAVASSMRAFQQGCARPGTSLTSRYLVKLMAYHVLTQPRLHRFSRGLYEALGQRQPLPTPTSGDELQGRRPPAYEVRLADAQAALGLRQLERLPANVSHRRRIAAIYEKGLRALGARVPRPPADAAPSYVRYPVWVEDRAAAVRAMAPHVVLGTWFTSVLEEAVSPEHGGYEQGSCPRAEAAARHLVNLPTHPRVRPDDAERMLSALTPFVSRPATAGWRVGAAPAVQDRASARAPSPARRGEGLPNREPSAVAGEEGAGPASP